MTINNMENKEVKRKIKVLKNKALFLGIFPTTKTKTQMYDLLIDSEFVETREASRELLETLVNESSLNFPQGNWEYGHCETLEIKKISGDHRTEKYTIRKRAYLSPIDAI